MENAINDAAPKRRNVPNKVIRLLKIQRYDELLTIGDLMAILRVGKNSVYLLQNSGLLPYLQLGDRKVRRRAVEEFMAKWEGCTGRDVIEIARERLAECRSIQ